MISAIVEGEVGDQEQGDGFGGPWRAAIGVEWRLRGGPAVAEAGAGQEHNRSFEEVQAADRLKGSRVDGDIEDGVADQVGLFEAIQEGSALEGGLAVVFRHPGVGKDLFDAHVEGERDGVARLPEALDFDVGVGLDFGGQSGSVDAHLGVGRPLGHAEAESEFGWLFRLKNIADIASPGQAGIHFRLEAQAGRQPPIEAVVVVEVEPEVVAVFGRDGVEIAAQGHEGPLEVRRAAEGVVPGVADLVAGGSQRVAVAIERAGQRHAGVDAVVQGAFHDGGVGGRAGGGQHALSEEPVGDGGAGFGVGLLVGQFVGVAEGFAGGAGADAAGDKHFGGCEVGPERLEGLGVGFVAGFHPIVGGAGGGIEGAHGVAFKLAAGGEGRAAEHVGDAPRRQFEPLPFNAAQQITGQVEVLLQPCNAISLDQRCCREIRG